MGKGRAKNYNFSTNSIKVFSEYMSAKNFILFFIFTK